MRIEEAALKFYLTFVSEKLKSALLLHREVEERSGIFSSVVTVWLMIHQRISPDHSLAAALEKVQDGWIDSLLSERSIRVRGSRISNSTGGYSRARSKLSVEAAEIASDTINEALSETHSRQTWNGRRVFAIDGTTLRLSHTEDNCRNYPQYKNQHKEAHFPLLFLGIATDVVSGVALRPSFGAYSGEERTHEIALAEELMPRLPNGAIVIGDRFYGCARFVELALSHGHDALCRVKERDASKYIGKNPKGAGDVRTNWISTRSRTGNHYSAEGRFVWHTKRKKGFRPQLFIYFTTLEHSLEDLAELYEERWNVETDIRDLKSTLGMEMLSAKSPEMIAKEVILGVCAYNLVRHLMKPIALQLRCSPRDLSFARVLKMVRSMADYRKPLGQLKRSPLKRLLQGNLSFLKHPKRLKPRPAEPRKVWPKGESNSNYMRGSRDEERMKLLKNRTVAS